MNLQLHDWHWLILGMGLIIAELFVPSFTIFWFGLGALVVAGCLYVVPGLAPSGQLLIWALASALFTWLWFQLIRPRMKDRTKAGISREAVVGESGRVIRTPEADRRGTVRFATPLLGADEWPFICQQTVGIGDRVFVSDISGNTLIVEKRE